MIKEEIINAILDLLDERIARAEIGIAAAIESRDNETKSSMGDKYETGRAMMQLEQQKNELQKSKAQDLKRIVSEVDLKKAFVVAAVGSLITTKAGRYFLCVGLGKLKLTEEEIVVLSAESPLGAAFRGKAKGDKFIFRDKEFEVIDVC